MKKIKKTTVTIGTSALNEELNIRYMLESVLKQVQKTIKIKEIVIQSDGSTDKTVMIARSYMNRSVKVKVVPNRTRRGVAYRINQMLEHFDSDVFVMIDSDMALLNKNSLEQIVKPIRQRKSIGLVMGNTVPVNSETFVEKAVNNFLIVRSMLSGIYEYKSRAYGAHAYLAYSRSFAKSLRLPREIMNCDAYSYFMCLAMKKKVVFAKKAEILFRSPQTLHDHIHQSKRHLAGGLQLNMYFGADVVEREFNIPFRYLFLLMIVQLLRNPFGYLFLKSVNFYAAHKSKKTHESFSINWEQVTSAKKIVNSQ